MRNFQRQLSFILTSAMACALASCATAPKGGPTRYALDRAAKAGDVPGSGEDGDELKFGLFCTGYFCAESYEVSAMGFVPLIGGAYPDKPNTRKLFSKKRTFKDLLWLKSFDEPQDSDVIVRFNLDRGSALIKAEVVSAYSHRPLYHVECKRCLPGIGAAIFDDFKPGAKLYKTVAAEREAHYKRLDNAGNAGISREDLEGIVKAAVAGAAQAPKKEPEAPAIRSDVDTPAFKAPENPDAFALVIGIEKYSNIETAASFAERDAEAVKANLHALGFPVRNVHVLLGGKATRTAIEKYLEHWLPLNIKETSRVIFYFSGHGAPDVKNGQAYLVPWDGDPNFLESTAYPVSRLYEKLNALEAKEVIVALDACFSGAGGRSVLAKGARPLVTKIETGAVPRQGKLALLAAASAEEITSSIEAQGHGIFTYYLLKGLAGGAKDASGAVTVGGLLDYLKPKVQDEARRQGREQTPVLQGEHNAGWVLRQE
ncbi:MAG: caspase family protein [Elusimicrobia bacterium]|nr:caspase family protein [Elusimicrobiota bacterium]